MSITNCDGGQNSQRVDLSRKKEEESDDSPWNVPFWLFQKKKRVEIFSMLQF